MKKIAALAMAAAMIMGLPGFAAREDNSIVYSLNVEPKRLDVCAEEDNFRLMGQLVQSLLELDENGQPAPGAAESYAVSEDGKTYTFTLRADGKWWDGERVTAQDFCYGWTQLLKNGSGSPYAEMGYCIQNAQAYAQGRVEAEALGLRAADERTFEVTLERPMADFPYLAACVGFAPRRQDYDERYGAEYGTDAGKIMGNGAYRLAEWKPEEQITLVKNEQYYARDRIAIERLVGVKVRDAAQAYALFEEGALDMVDLNATTSLLAEQNGRAVQSYSDGTVCFLRMNCEQSPTANANIRRALGLAINRRNLVNNVLRDNSLPALSFSGEELRNRKGKPFSEGVSVDYQDADAEKAALCWTQGLEELGMSPAEAASAIQLVLGEDDLSKQQAIALRRDWKAALGVEIKIEHLPEEEWGQRVRDGAYGATIERWRADCASPAGFLEYAVETRGWNSAECRELVQSARTQADLEKRMELLNRAETILLSEMPLTPLYFPMCDAALADGLSGVRRSAFGQDDFKNAGWSE